MKQRNQIIALIVLLLVAAFTWRSFYSHQPATTPSVTLAADFPELAVENPQLHRWKMDAARKAEYKPNGRNIFIEAPIPPPPAPKSHEPPGPVEPITPPPPPPPVLPVKFFGYGAVPTWAPRRAFFSDGEQVYVVAEGEVLLGRYRILKIGNATLEFEEISTQQHGTATLEEPPGPQA